MIPANYPLLSNYQTLWHPSLIALAPLTYCSGTPLILMRGVGGEFPMLGNKKEARMWRDKAEHAGELISEEDDKGFFAEDLKTIDALL